MKFDQLDNQPCLLPQLNAESCEVTRLPTEEGRLELRPEVAVVAVLGSVQYRTFLIANGVEREVTSGLSYRSGSYAIAVIGAIGGNATGVAVGIVTISVEWQGLEAFAQLQVVESCDNVSNGLMIVLDNSESMNQPFGGAYGSKLDFAKFLAKQFAGEVDVRKDIVGLTTFAVSAEVVAPLTADNISVGTAIMGVGFVPEHTDIYAGLKAAISTLQAANVDRRVILLITDGQHNDDIEPLQVALQFRSSGGVLIVIGLRDGLEAFMRLEKLANGGFFISAYDDATAEDAKRYVSGLKGYLCAGNCCPEGDAFVGMGAYNYKGWLNWDSVGNVDLIGNGFYELIPGHGLFVDLVGSSAPWQGGLISKKSFTFQNGKNYKLSYKLAGNQRFDAPGFSVKVLAGSIGSAVHTLDDWRQDFTTYELSFVGNGTTGKLLFLQETIPSISAAQSFGNLLDDVKLLDVDTNTILFADMFDQDNLTYISPACGVGTVYGQGYGGGYAYGTCCYGTGCLTEPVKQQNPDPMPPTDPETTPDPSWTSTQSYTASCPVGTTGSDVTRSASYKSFISAADANAKALLLAQTAAEAALNCVNPPVAGELINLHAFSGTGNNIGAPSQKHGPAAFGLTANDFWNTFEYSDVPLLKSDGTQSMVKLRKCTVGTYPGTELPSTPDERLLNHADPMYRLGYAFYDDLSIAGQTEGMFFDGLEEGDYEIYVYGHGDITPSQVGKYTVRTGRVTGSFVPDASGFTFDETTDTEYLPPKSTSALAPPNTGNYLEPAWAENAQFVKFAVTVSAGQTGILLVVGTALPPDAPTAIQLATPFLMGVQIVRMSTAPSLLAKVNLDGVNDYVAVADSATLDVITPFTVEVTVKLDTISGHGFISKGMSFPAGPLWYLRANVTTTMKLAGKVGGDIVESAGLLSVDTWMRLALVSNGSFLRLYINGVLDGVVAGAGVISATTGPVAIGGVNNGSGGGITNFLNGIISEARIWNVARSAADIMANQMADVTGQTGLVAYWKFNQMSGASAPDATGNGNTGTLVT